MVLAIIEHVEYPFGKGDLTSDGIQWSAEADTVEADTDTAVETVTIKPPALGGLIEVEFGLTAAFRAVSSATADITLKWQARNQGGDWVDLHQPVTRADIGTAYVEDSRSGRVAFAEGFDSLPFDLRLVMRCDEAGQGRAKVKNSSYVRVKYAAS